MHRLDAARVYRLAIEANAIGGRFHAVAEEGIAFREIAAWIGRHLGVPVIRKSPEAAVEHFGRFAGFAALDAPASSAWTRVRLDWAVRQPGLLDDIEHASYFDA